ncbi:MAG: LysM peptidoglycan-binding domain-containing protein, partial [Pseudopedobacter sp.]|nr:LysM peptidoglycan-binding domain-containing protein [Deinococcales bacterium]
MNKTLRWVLTAFLFSSSALAQGVQHTVQKGDTAYSISKKYGLTLEQLLSWNNLLTSSVLIGQVLTVQERVFETAVENAAPDCDR